MKGTYKDYVEYIIVVLLGDKAKAGALKMINVLAPRENVSPEELISITEEYLSVKYDGVFSQYKLNKVLSTDAGPMMERKTQGSHYHIIISPNDEDDEVPYDVHINTQLR